MVREDSERVTFEMRPDLQKDASLAIIWGQCVPGRERSK